MEVDVCRQQQCQQEFLVRFLANVTTFRWVSVPQSTLLDGLTDRGQMNRARRLGDHSICLLSNNNNNNCSNNTNSSLLRHRPSWSTTPMSSRKPCGPLSQRNDPRQRIGVVAIGKIEPQRAISNPQQQRPTRVGWLFFLATNRKKKKLAKLLFRLSQTPIFSYYYTFVYDQVFLSSASSLLRSKYFSLCHTVFAYHPPDSLLTVTLLCRSKS